MQIIQLITRFTYLFELFLFTILLFAIHLFIILAFIIHLFRIIPITISVFIYFAFIYLALLFTRNQKKSPLFRVGIVVMRITTEGGNLLSQLSYVIWPPVDFPINLDFRQTFPWHLLSTAVHARIPQ